MSESSVDVVQSSELIPSASSLRPKIVDLAACLETFRRTVLRETADIVSAPVADDPDYRAEAFPRVAAMLASSLEELRVAEEELVEQTSTLLSRQHDYQRHVDYERRLFDFAPTPLLTTDLMGAISDANRAATDLLGKPKEHLDHKPMVTFVPLEERSAFRDQLGRMTIAEGTTDW
jgi:PAS domain-containing protein